MANIDLGGLTKELAQYLYENSLRVKAVMASTNDGCMEMTFEIVKKTD